MKIKCKKCGDIIQGDRKGNFIMCKCGACAIDENPYYIRLIGMKEDYEEIKEEWV